MKGRWWYVYGIGVILMTLVAATAYMIGFGFNFVPKTVPEALIDMMCFNGLLVGLGMVAHGKTLLGD